MIVEEGKANVGEKLDVLCLGENVSELWPMQGMGTGTKVTILEFSLLFLDLLRMSSPAKRGEGLILNMTL